MLNNLSTSSVVVVAILSEPIQLPLATAHLQLLRDMLCLCNSHGFSERYLCQVSAALTDLHNVEASLGGFWHSH